MYTLAFVSFMLLVSYIRGARGRGEKIRARIRAEKVRDLNQTTKGSECSEHLLYCNYLVLQLS